MAVKNFREGLRLVPVSADPINPTEGQLQYADGTSRPEGIYVFSNGAWTTVGSATVTEELNCVSLVNDSFDGDLTGWTFTTTNTSTATGVSVDTTSPISGLSLIHI